MRRQIHVDREHERFVEAHAPAETAAGVVALAPHGGDVEPPTDEQALALRDRLDAGAGAWLCRGTVAEGNPFERWHVTSTELSRASFEFLGDVLDRGYRRAVAFHGLAPGKERVVVGGRAERGLRERLREELAARVPAPVVVSETGPYAGVDPDNVVNRAARLGGLQVEQPAEVRHEHADAVVDAVVTALDGAD